MRNVSEGNRCVGDTLLVPESLKQCQGLFSEPSRQLEGMAAAVRDTAELQRAAEAYATKYAWHVRIQNGAFDADYGAPTAGPPPYELYALKPQHVFGFGVAETWSPTRWRF